MVHKQMRTMWENDNMQPFLNILSVTAIVVFFLILASAVFFFLSVRVLYKILKVTRSITHEQIAMAQIFYPNVKIPEGKEGELKAMGHVELGLTWDDNKEPTG